MQGGDLDRVRNQINCKQAISSAISSSILKNKRQKKNKNFGGKDDDKPVQGMWIEEAPGGAIEVLLHNTVFLLTSEKSASLGPDLHLFV